VLWDEAEAALQAHIETQWAMSAFASIQLVFENEVGELPESYIFIDIQGTFPEKYPYGAVGSRCNIEHGIIFYHCFVPAGTGKQAAVRPARALQTVLELQTVADVIKIEGANPLSPAEQSDNLLPDRQPGGNYYRVSGSVPFFLIGS
jgi:hypothetical protein